MTKTISMLGVDGWEIRLITAEEYINFIAKMYSNKHGDISSYVIELLNKCLIKIPENFKQPLFDNISKAQGEQVLINILVHSKISSTDKTLIIKPSADYEYFTEIDPLSCYVSPIDQELYEKSFNSELSKFTYNLTDKTVLVLDQPKLFEDDNRLDMVINNMSGLIVEPEFISIDTLSEEELNHLMTLIAPEHIIDIIEILENEKLVAIGQPFTDSEAEPRIITGVAEIVKAIEGK